MTVYTLDPLQDSRWAELIARHPQASVFHTMAWLQTLRRTYGYQPTVFTTTGPESALDNGIVFCQVRSWLTGRRLVSLPFSDHCEPLVDDAEASLALLTHLEHIRRDSGWDYIELRPHSERLNSTPGLAASERFWFHVLDLRRDESALFDALHKDSIQRKIHRARREGLAYDEGRSERLLGEFYELLVITRQRHQLPPQPLAWFKNLVDAFGGSLKIRVARQGDRAVAAILTIHHGPVMVYKYGASDATFHPLGGMQLLLWNTIRDACSTGCGSLDLGRSDTDNDGLAIFKDRWNARRTAITYLRYSKAGASRGVIRKYATDGVKQVLDHVPGPCRTAAGRFLYKHAG